MNTQERLYRAKDNNEEYRENYDAIDWGHLYGSKKCTECAHYSSCTFGNHKTNIASKCGSYVGRG